MLYYYTFAEHAIGYDECWRDPLLRPNGRNIHNIFAVNEHVLDLLDEFKQGGLELRVASL